jgi:Ca2+/H+ antiporter
MKIIITVFLFLFVAICFISIKYNSNKFNLTKRKKYLNLVLFLVILSTVVPFFITYKILPESLNHPLNGLLSLIVIIFGWTLIPKGR